MKKILPKLALAFLPIVIYLIVFLAFEPNNYFSLRKNSSTNSPIARIRAYEANPQNAIILGDSRMAHFDMDLVEQTFGSPVSNVAYGGAGLDESIDEFYYLYSQNPNINTVVFGVSFYTLNEAYNPVNRMKTVETQLKNPAAYIFNLEYNVNTLTVMADRFAYFLRGEPYVDLEETATHSKEEYEDENGALAYRNNLIDYAATLYANCATKGTSLLPSRQYSETQSLLNAREIADYMLNEVTESDSKFSVNQNSLSRLVTLSEFCQDNNINLTFVLPPMDNSLLELLCKPLGIDKAMESAIETLTATSAQVLNYEWANPNSYDDTAFYDGFHLDTKHGLPQWTQTLFSQVKQ